MPDTEKAMIVQPSPPVNGDQMSPGTIRKLGTYFVLLGLTLLYLAFVIWPPDYQSLPAAGTKEEDKGKNPISPIVFFDCGPAEVRGAEAPVKAALEATKPPAKEKVSASAAEPSSPDPKSTDIAGAHPAAPTAPIGSSSPTATEGKPASDKNTETNTSPGSASSVIQSSAESRRSCAVRLYVTYDQRLFLLVLILGALGSYIHAVMSFADYAGNRRLVQSWLWWYLLRPFTGAPTALVLYFAVRAGFMTPTASGGDVSRFGISALAMLAGMFSMKAADKLEEVFDVLFKTQEKRKDSLENVAPVLSSINPVKVKVGSGAQKVLLEGSHFSAKAVVLVGGSERPGSVDSAAKLSFDLTADDTNAARAIKVAVKNPAPGGGTSNSLTLTVAT